MKYYEDDRARLIPEEYLKMTQEELDLEIDRVYQKYYGNNSKKEKSLNLTLPIKLPIA